MSRELRYLDGAKSELEEATAFYEARQRGLGVDFQQEVSNLIETIMRFPLSGRKFYKTLRGLKVRRFPYVLIYEPTDDEIVVISVTHGARRPGHWKSRLR